MKPAKKKPAKKSPKKRTAGVEVVKVKGHVSQFGPSKAAIGREVKFYPTGCGLRLEGDIDAILTLHIPKRRSSK